MIDRGKARFSGKVEKTIANQDHCFLSKRNNVHDEPRKIIESIPGAKLSELGRTRERSACCRGGGGRMWHDIRANVLLKLRLKKHSSMA
ncbi:MAG: (Fe-S)-binding protein [Candidatus Bathyarchaeota archaeon]|nr:MAG: (Fe-S)-binding protein [Candidatus Bathyarchaeota archaeon]